MIFVCPSCLKLNRIRAAELKRKNDRKPKENILDVHPLLHLQLFTLTSLRKKRSLDETIGPTVTPFPLFCPSLLHFH